jgi:hypothetical protein
MTQTKVISADSHVMEPADFWETRLDRKYRDNAQCVVPKRNGRATCSSRRRSIRSRSREDLPRAAAVTSSRISWATAMKQRGRADGIPEFGDTPR